MRQSKRVLLVFLALPACWPLSQAHAQSAAPPSAAAPSTTSVICQFDSGPRAGSAATFQTDHGPLVAAGTACTDNDGSNGLAIADDGTKIRTTVCQFDSGPKAGFAFDLAGRGGMPLPVGAACTDGKDSSGKAMAIGIAIPTATLTKICRVTFGPKAGLTFDVTSLNLPPMQVGAPCSDRDGNIGIGIR